VKLATYTTPSGSWSSPTIANGRLYIGNHDWNVYCFANTVTASAATEAPSRNSTLNSYLPAIGALLTAILLAIALAIVYLGRRAKKARLTA